MILFKNLNISIYVFIYLYGNTFYLLYIWAIRKFTRLHTYIHIFIYLLINLNKIYLFIYFE